MRELKDNAEMYTSLMLSNPKCAFCRVNFKGKAAYVYSGVGYSTVQVLATKEGVEKASYTPSAT